MFKGLATLTLCIVTNTHAEPLFVPDQYPTIQAAIDAAQPGDEIHIAPGIYRELLDPENKSLTLIGAGPEQTILSGDLDGDTVADGTILLYDNEGTDTPPILNLGNMTFVLADSVIDTGRAGDISIENCYFESSGIAIRVRWSQITDVCAFDVTVLDSFFQNCLGGIQLNNTLSLSVTDTIFTDMQGRSIVARCDSVRIHNVRVADSTEGLIHILSPDATITDCIFERNVSLQNASALVLVSEGLIEVDNCHFVQNGSFTSSGPALLVDQFSDVVRISNCLFDGNVGQSGSAVAAWGQSHFNNCIFTRNVSRDVGPINFGDSRGPNSTVTNCDFIDNGAIQPDGSYWPGGGGGLCIESGGMTIRDSRFTNNFATKAGGVMVQSTGKSMIERCTFHGNRAEYEAGAVYASRHTSISNSEFIGNTAGLGRGGVIFSHNFPQLSNNVFIGNSAKHGQIVFSHLRPTLDSVHQFVFNGNIVVPTQPDEPLIDSYRGSGTPPLLGNLITNQIQSIGFIRIPNHGGDGFGDDPRTPDIDESLNDDYGDLRLLPGSPAIDAGGNTKLPRDVYDLDRDGDRDEFLVGLIDLAGNPRFVDDPSASNHFDAGGLPGPIDLGPYEYQPASRTMTVRTKHINPDR